MRTESGERVRIASNGSGRPGSVDRITAVAWHPPIAPTRSASSSNGSTPAITDPDCADPTARMFPRQTTQSFLSPRRTEVYGPVAARPLRSFGFSWLPLITSRYRSP